MRLPPEQPVNTALRCENAASTQPTRHTAKEHSEILRGMLSVALFVLLGKLAGAAKEMVVAWRYGVSAEVDAYLFLFNLVNWPISLWLGLLTSALVPVLAKARAGAVQDLRQFHAELLGRTLVLGVFLGLSTFLLLAALLRGSLSGLSFASLSAARDMILPCALLLPLGALIGLLSTSMLAHGRHANTLLESVPAVVVGLSVAMAGDSGIEALTWGTLAGFACHTLCLAIPMRESLSRPLLSAQSPHWPAFLTGFSVMLLCQVLSSLTSLVDQFFVSRLAEGALSTMNYAQRILALIIGLGATAVGRAVIPVLARSTDADRLHLHRITIHWVRIVFVAGVIAIAIGWYLGPWGIRILFERGAFTPQDTHAVVMVFRPGLLQLPFNFAAVILFYALAGRRRYRALAGIAATCLVAKLGLNALLVPSLGIDGVMYSTAITYALLMLMYLHVLGRTTGSNV